MTRRVVNPSFTFRPFGKAKYELVLMLKGGHRVIAKFNIKRNIFTKYDDRRPFVESYANYLDSRQIE